MKARRSVVRKIIDGDFMDSGFVRDLAPRTLALVIVDGKAYDASMYDKYEPCGRPLSDARLTLDVYGCLSAAGAAYEFLPDEGEIDRIGRNAFAAL